MDVCLKSNGKALKKDTASIGPCPTKKEPAQQKKTLSTKKGPAHKKRPRPQKKTPPTKKDPAHRQGPDKTKSGSGSQIRTVDLRIMIPTL